jgi:hypothetical protein
VRIQRHNAIQVHPVPEHVRDARGPFPAELFREPEIIHGNYDKTEFGESDPIGSTTQTNFKAPRVMVCSLCDARMLENKTGDHVCGG